MEVSRRAGRAVFLVDAYLLDTLVAALALGVKDAALVHCTAQVDAARLARDVLAGRGVFARLVDVGDAPRLDDARRIMGELGRDWHLHHTGGPDGLSALMIRAAIEHGVPATDASMLDEERRLLRFDDGLDLPLQALVADTTVTVEEVIQLAGHEVRRARRIRPPDEVVLDVAQWRLDRGTDEVPPRLERFAATLDESETGRLRQWLDGAWLEDFVALATTAATRPGLPSDITASIPLGHFEIDVLAIIGHRPHAISCTVSGASDVVRHKAFEVERRAWQLGGPIVRPAVVAPISADARPSPETIEGAFEDPLEQHHSSELEIFDRDELRAWLEALREGRRPLSLAAWIDAGLAQTRREVHGLCP